ncbi:hypothetical protein DL735_24825 [Escherichia coli]|nr:hypothetical protein [Escherichia coli]
MLTHVITNCNFFKRGMQELFFCKKGVSFVFGTTINELRTIPEEELQIILVVELTTLNILKKFWEIVNFISKKKIPRVGIVITKNNAYLMRYLSKKNIKCYFFLC